MPLATGARQSKSKAIIAAGVTLYRRDRGNVPSILLGINQEREREIAIPVGGGNAELLEDDGPVGTAIRKLAAETCGVIPQETIEKIRQRVSDMRSRWQAVGRASDFWVFEPFSGGPVGIVNYFISINNLPELSDIENLINAKLRTQPMFVEVFWHRFTRFSDLVEPRCIRDGREINWMQGCFTHMPKRLAQFLDLH